MNYSPDLTAAAIKMAVALVVVLAMVWGLYRVAKKVMPAARGAGEGALMRIMENQYLGIKKNILMVRVPGAVLVLGVTADHIQLLTRLDDPEIVKQIEAEYAYPQKASLTFKSQLTRFMRAKAE